MLLYFFIVQRDEPQGVEVFIFVQQPSEYSKLESSWALRGPTEREVAGYPCCNPEELEGSHFRPLLVGLQESGF